MTSTLQSGIEQAIREIEKAETKPIMVAVYGPQSREKSQLTHEILNYFSARRQLPYISRNLPDQGIIEDIKQGHGFDLYLFQCNGERTPDQDPNVVIERELGRPVNLNVLVYDQQLSQPAGEYDLIIALGEEPEKKEPEKRKQGQPVEKTIETS